MSSEVLCTRMFPENLYSSTKYLGRIDMIRADQLKFEERFSISEQGYTVGKLLDGTECQILLDVEQVNHSCPKHII